MLYEQQISAGSPLALNVPGRFFLLDATGAAESLTVELLRGGSPIVGRIPGAKRGLKIGIEAGFDGVRLESAVDTVVRFFATFENVSVSTIEGAAVSIPGGVAVINAPESPIPVTHTGTVNLTADKVGIVNRGVTITPGAYTVTAAGNAVSTPANANRRAMHLRNAGHESIYLAAYHAIDADHCPVMLRAGETLLVDDRTATGEWWAYSKGDNVTVMTQEAIEL